MRKISAMIVLVLIANGLLAQCIPSAPGTVHDSLLANVGATKNIQNIPTGSVIKLDIPVANTFVLVDMCATTSATDDSYITVLTDNSASASSIDHGDDGCASGYGTYKQFEFTTAGTYYLYLTEYSGTDPCIADGVNSIYDMDLTVSLSAAVAANDHCSDAETLTLDVTLASNNFGATTDTASEGIGYGPVGIHAACNYPDGPETYNTVWYSFNAATAGTYYMVISSVDYLQLYATAYPAADINCTDIAQSDLQNGLCRFIEGRDDTIYFTLAAGDYLIPLSSENDIERGFSLTMHKAPFDANCSQMSVGTLSTQPCWQSNGQTFEMDLQGTYTTAAVGNKYGFYEIFATGPITNFANPTADPNILGVSETTSGTDDWYVPLDNTYLAVGDYYYYFVSAGNVQLVNDTFYFDTTCMQKTGVAFSIIPGDQTCPEVGIDEISADAFKVYPNPASDKLYVQVTGQRNFTDNYRIMNTAGQVIIEGIIADNAADISIQQLSPGIYFISLDSGDTYTVKRFTVIR